MNELMMEGFFYSLEKNGFDLTGTSYRPGVKLSSSRNSALFKKLASLWKKLQSDAARKAGRVAVKTLTKSKRGSDLGVRAAQKQKALPKSGIFTRLQKTKK